MMVRFYWKHFLKVKSRSNFISILSFCNEKFQAKKDPPVKHEIFDIKEVSGLLTTVRQSRSFLYAKLTTLTILLISLKHGGGSII